MNKNRSSNYLLSPVVIYLLVLFIVPMSILFIYSFWLKGIVNIIPTFTLKNYWNIFATELYRHIIWNSVRIGLITAIICVLMSYPVAYALTFKYKRFQDFALYLMLVSLFSSYLVRVYAWKVILGDKGFINQILIFLGLITKPLSFLLYSPTAVIITLVFVCIPYTILPIFSAMQNINIDYVEAAHDLGASNRKTFWKVTLPLSMSGVISGFTFSFILAAGDYVTPQMVGGTSGLMIGRIIADQFGMLYNWPLGSALAYFMMFLLILIVNLIIWALSMLKLRREF